MASLEEQTDNSFYGFTPQGLEQETKKYEVDPDEEQKRKEAFIKGATSVGTGVVTGALGLPSDLLDLATLANDLSADYTGNVVSKAIQPKLNEIQEKYGRDAFDKAFTEVTGIKSDASNPNQMLGELISLGSVIKYGAKGVGAVAKGLGDVADQTKKAFQPQAVTPEGITMPVPEQPKGGQVSEIIGGRIGIDELGKDPKYQDSIKQPEGLIGEIYRSEKGKPDAQKLSAAKALEYANLQSRHNSLLENNKFDEIKQILSPDELSFIRRQVFLKNPELLKDLDAAEKITDTEMLQQNKNVVAELLQRKRYAETGVYVGRTGKTIDGSAVSQIRFEIPDVDASLNTNKVNAILEDLNFHGYDISSGKVSEGYLSSDFDGLPEEIKTTTLGELLNHDMLYAAYGKQITARPLSYTPKREYQSIKDIPIEITPTTARASYSRNSDTIKLNPKLLLEKPENIKSSILHEIQHAVQSREGFESGSGVINYYTDAFAESDFTQPFFKKNYFFNEYKKLLKKGMSDSAIKTQINLARKVATQVDTNTKKAKKLNLETMWANLEPEGVDYMDGIDWDALVTKMVDETNFVKKKGIPKEYKKLVELAIKENFYKKVDNIAETKYYNTLGELEARTVQARDKFSTMLKKQGLSRKEILDTLKKVSPLATRDLAGDIKLSRFMDTATEKAGVSVPIKEGNLDITGDVEGIYSRTRPTYSSVDELKKRNENVEEQSLSDVSKETDDMLINMLGDEGIGAEHPNIQEAVNKYVYDVDKSSIEKAIASPDYPAYKADLQRVLKKEFPDGKIPVTRIINYAEAQALKEKPKKVKSVLDIEDVAFAGNEAEKELIANLNGDLTSFSIDNVKKEMNKGGVPTMANKNLESQQLELFGGLKDQGGMKDPATGNEVPVGSTKKEVRDDIPAQLSEGEFVLPSDVVRYHGLEKIMGLRDQAKQGLGKMEAMGQMGNADQATLPENTPFNPQVQQPIQAAYGADIQDPSELQKKQSVFQTRNPYGQQPLMSDPWMPIINPGEPPKVEPPKVDAPTVKPRTFADTMGGTKFGEIPKTENKQYKNPETGEVMTIPFVNGEPIYPIPAGFVPIEQAKDNKPDVVQDVLVPTTQVTKDDRDRPSASQVAGTGSFSLGNLNLGSLAGGALGSIFGGPIGGLIGSKISGQLGQQGEVKPLTGDLGYGNLSAAKQAMGSYKILGDATATGQVGTNVGDTDVNTKGIFNNSFSVATDISDLSKYGGAMRDENGHTVYRTINEQVKSLKAAAKTGWFGGPLSPMEYYGLTDDNKMKYNSYAQEAGFNEQNYGTGKGQELYNEFTNNLPKYNISGVNQPLPTSVKNDDTGESGDGYLVSNGKAYKGTYVYNKTSGDMQFEKADGSGTIVAVSKDDGSPALVGDLTGSGSKTVAKVQEEDEMAGVAEAQALAKKQAKAKKAEENRKAVIAAQMKKEIEQRQEQADRREEERNAREAEAARTKVSRIFEERGGPSAKELQKGTKRRHKEGGLMTKPKVMNMKRGGLASR